MPSTCVPPPPAGELGPRRRSVNLMRCLAALAASEDRGLLSLAA